MYRLGTKVNLKVFFRVLGVTLMLFAAGLLADAMENLQQLGWITLGSHVLWNSSGFMSESSSIGDIFHSLLGYADQPTVLQGLVWIAYVVVSVGIFVRLGRRPHTPSTTSQAPSVKN
jgi:high-affinity iron transporter